MPSPDYKALAKKAFQATCTWVRQRGGPPSQERLYRYVLWWTRTNASEGLNTHFLPVIANSISKYIAANYDDSLARPEPQRPGRLLAIEESRILSLYRAAELAGESISIRKIAAQTGYSKSKVQRTLEKAAITPLRNQKLAALSEHAQRLALVVDRLLPSDGKRLLHLSEVEDILNRLTLNAEAVDSRAVEEAALEISGSRLNIQVWMSDVNGPRLSKLLMISRGRRLSEVEARRWLEERVREQTATNRPGINQRIFPRLKSQLFFGPVVRDLAAVLNVRLNCHDLGSWRDFIIATAGGGELARPHLPHVAYDLAKIVSMAATYVRSSSDPGVFLPHLSDWVREALDRETAGFTFKLALELIQSGWTDQQCIEYWMQKSEYRTRIPFLTGRKVADLDEVLAAADPDDEDGVWRALVRLDEWQGMRSPAELGPLPFEDGTVHQPSNPVYLQSDDLDLAYEDFASDVADLDEVDSEPWNPEGFIFEPDREDIDLLRMAQTEWKGTSPTNEPSKLPSLDENTWRYGDEEVPI